jgi:hypothetical protein
VQLIRQHVEDTKDFKTAEVAAKSALAQLSASAEALVTSVAAALPWYLKTTGAKRRETGFAVTRIRNLLGDHAEEFVGPWLVQTRQLVRAGNALRYGAEAAHTLVEKQAADLATTLNPQELQAVFTALATLRATFAAAIDAYKAPETALLSVLNEVLDAQSDTAGWQDFLDIVRQAEKLRGMLVERRARATVEKELEAALKQIDQAKEQVLDDKFSDYSGRIQDWWERLRPDETTFFSAVQPARGRNAPSTLRRGSP